MRTEDEGQETEGFDATATLREDEEDTAFGVPGVTDDAPYTLGKVIGVGGSSVVREARQEVLHRSVAIKRLIGKPPTRAQERQLLREAWVTGLLEHPSVVPVHDIRVEDGQPMIVMKRVEGVVWSSAIDDPRARFPGIDDPLAWNLRVLIQVCQAVAFAHSRDVLHRDLKPENVMIGAYGEILVMDWGIAVALRDRFDGRVPLATHQRGLAGTPAYLPPEMAAGDGRLLSERTDVYLLGGILHRIIAKRPPRTGKSLGGIVARAQWEDISVDPGWPLADLLVRSLSRAPEARPESVDAFRAVIEDFLEQRATLELVSAARAKADELGRAIDAGRERMVVHDLFGACRFAYEVALARSPQAPGAREGLHRALERMAAFEIAHEDERSARFLLRQIPSPDADLLARVTALEARRLRDEERLSALSAELDPLQGTGVRMLGLVGMGAVWLGPPAFGALIGIPSGYPREAFITGTTAALSVAAVAAVWPWLRRTRINRVMLGAVVLSPVFASVLLAACAIAGVPDAEAAALRTFAFVAASAFAAVHGDLRLTPGALGFGVALMVGAAWPDLAALALAAANAFLVLNGVVVWFPSALGLRSPGSR